MQAVVEQQVNSHKFNPSGAGGSMINPATNPGNCRVYTPNACSLINFNTWDIHNVNINPILSSYRPVMHGNIERLDNAGLRLSQRRSFIPYEQYNTGCTGPYCLTADSAPNGTIVPNPPASEQLLFNDVFQSIDLDIGNSGPRSCIGIKGESEGSFFGWSTNEQGQLRWMQAAQERKSCDN